MKHLNSILGIFALAAFLFTSCQQGANNSPAASDAGSASAEGAETEVSISDLKIAYILTDSVIANYEFFKKKSEEIAEKGRRFEGELSSRARGFEQEVANFEQTAQSMTPNQARAKQEDLVKKERNLMSYRDNIMQELSGDEQKLYADVYERIHEFLDSYAKQNDLEMILSNTRGGAVWYSKKSLDITDDVVKGLNEAYAKGNE
ncbi:MAG: OmpH family outer membrane protein [Nitritalea sp.]